MWDIKSVILYLVMASIGYFCISEERRSIQNGVRRRLKVSYAILFFVWLFLAVYRYVGYESGIIIGGNDAPTYIDYFQTCLAGKGNNIYFVRTEPLFQIMTKAVRTITSNYHVYFALIYPAFPSWWACSCSLRFWAACGHGGGCRSSVLCPTRL